MAMSDNADRRNSEIPESIMTPNWTIHVSEVKTIRVGNVSKAVSEQDVREFFSFSGDIRYVEMQRESDTTQLAYVTFKEPQGVDTAVLLSGATIGDLCVTITPVDDYQLPPEAQFPPSPDKKSNAIQKAEDVVSSMLARGFVLGTDAINRAKDFDDRHQLTSSASATVALIDQQMGLTEKLVVGTTVVNDKVREMDARYQVSEKTRSAIAIAEETASNVKSTILSNQYVSAGASWVSNAIGVVTKTAEDVGNMTREKVEKANEEKKHQVADGQNETLVDIGKDGHQAAPKGESGATGGSPIMPNGSTDNKLEII